MKRANIVAALVVALCLPAISALADQAPYPQDDASLQKEYDALHWATGNGTYRLEHSHSALATPTDFHVLLGTDAQRYAFLGNGVEFPNTEAMIYDPKSEAEIAVEFVDEGFVKEDDWSEVDADDFLKQMQENQRSSNEERKANGKRPFDIIGWLEKPSYDPTTHVARYVLELGTTDDHWLNAVAIKLGRDGYHQFTWVGDLSQYQNGGPQALDMILAQHSYDDGHKYADFKEGDKMAAYGIAGLVAAVAGVKLGKGLLAGAIAFLAVAGKKLAILVVPLLAGVVAAVKRFFKRQ